MIQTYVPLYRKYRPQSFADVVGQQAIVQTLGNAINQGKVAHAYLFCGPRGTGKTSTARIFAKSLNCEQGPTVTPCQTCASCTGITQGNALDVVEFDAASNNKVDDARELIENAQFTPMAGKYKIYIIDEVHMLTTQAFNALLKTLEEPPPNVVFIFATTEAHKVLPTIISRCQRFDFTRITNQDIIQRLAWIAQQEQINIDSPALDAIARHVRGGMRDAVGLLDQVAVLGRAQPDKTVNREDVALFIGALEEDILIWIAQAIADKQPNILLQQMAELEKRGTEPAQLVKELTQHFRNLLLVAASQRSGTVVSEQIDLPETYFQKLSEQAPAFAVEELPQILARLSGIERNIRHTQQPQLWLEVGLLELAYREEIYLVKNLAERVAALEAQIQAQLAGGAAPVARPTAPATPPARPAASTPTSPVRPTPAAAPPAQVTMPHSSDTAETPPISPKPSKSTDSPAQSAMTATGGLAALYQRVCQQVASVTTRDLLTQQTTPLSLNGNRLTIGCSSEPILKIVKQPQKLIHLQKAVEKILGEGAQVDLVHQKPGEAQKPGETAPAAAAAPIAPPPAKSPAEPTSQTPTEQIAPVSPTVPQASLTPDLAVPPAQSSEDAPPPLVDDTPPADVQPSDNGLPVNGNGNGGSKSSAKPDMPNLNPMDPGDMDAYQLEEAKQFTIDLLQGRILS